MTFTQPLDLHTNLIKNFAGGEVVFIMLAILFILYFAAKNRMSFGAALPMIVFVILMIGSSATGGSFQPLLIAVLLVGALALTTVIVRLTDK